MPENDCKELELEGYRKGLGKNSRADRVNISYFSTL